MYWDPMPTVQASAALTMADTDRPLGPPEFYLLGDWDKRDWRNVPGPFYGAETDSCWTGRQIAPEHIVYEDKLFGEVVFRQPVTAEATRLVLSCAHADPFCAYAADGDRHWTPALVKQWWAYRPQLAAWLDRAVARWADSDREADQDNVKGLHAYAQYLAAGLESDLREYAFWLDNRRPAQPGERLPELG